MKLKRDRYDAAFSDYIRARDRWTCRRCGGKHTPPTSGLHCAHIYSRSNPTLRLDSDNAIALCHGCHTFFTGRPLEFRDWCVATLGSAHIESLKVKYYGSRPKVTKQEKEAMRKEFIERTQKLETENASCT